MQQTSSQPIGIFDSGIGGLTVAHALVQALPNENIVYFGDTAHLPYGDKSTAAIQAYSIKISDMLLQQNCKLILIACHSASAAAYELIKEYVGSKAYVLNVIDPMVNHLRENYANKTVGLIGTKQTIYSNIYKHKIDELNVGIQLKSLATPLLVPMIEEGFYSNRITAELIEQYLSHADLAQIHALILGCTHYPLIKKQIMQYYKEQIDLLDSADIVAASVKAFLSYHNLLNRSASQQKHFYISDFTHSFAHSAKIFFGEDIKLEHYPLWE